VNHLPYKDENRQIRLINDLHNLPDQKSYDILSLIKPMMISMNLQSIDRWFCGFFGNKLLRWRSINAVNEQ